MEFLLSPEQLKLRASLRHLLQSCSVVFGKNLDQNPLWGQKLLDGLQGLGMDSCLFLSGSSGSSSLCMESLLFLEEIAGRDPLICRDVFRRFLEEDGRPSESRGHPEAKETKTVPEQEVLNRHGGGIYLGMIFGILDGILNYLQKLQAHSQAESKRTALQCLAAQNRIEVEAARLDVYSLVLNGKEDQNRTQEINDRLRLILEGLIKDVLKIMKAPQISCSSSLSPVQNKTSLDGDPALASKLRRTRSALDWLKGL